ncbi:MAG: holin [Nocardioidaceae bacterium]
MFGSYFWRSTTERAVKSFAQSLLAILSASSFGLLQVDWLTCLSTAGMATLLSVLSSVASSRVGTAGDPSTVSTPATGPATGPGPEPARTPVPA